MTLKTAGWILALCLCTGAVWAETETFGTGEVDRTTLMVGDRVDVAYRGRTAKASIEEATGTVVDVGPNSFTVNLDGTLDTSDPTVDVPYEKVIRLDRHREIFWALDTTDLQISEGEFVAKYLGNNELTGLEGMWVWEDRSFELIVVKDESNRIKRFDYVGLVLATTRPGWRMGEIKMLIKETAKDGAYSAVFITDTKKEHNTLVAIRDEREILAMLPNEIETDRLEKRLILRTYPVPAEPEAVDAEQIKAREGSGFFVTREIIVTANHLVEGADRIEVAIGGSRASAMVRSRDKRNNLALLSISPDSRDTLSNATIVPLILVNPERATEGDRVVAAGYASHSAPRPSISEGIIKSLLGPDEDLTRFTISAVVRTNEVGGPLIDQSNRVVGILMPPDSSSAGPVQVALKSDLLRSLLKMSGVTTTPPDSAASVEALDTSLISQMARSAVVTIVAR